MTRRKASELDVAYVLAEYRRGRSLRDIALEVQFSHVHLWRVLKENNQLIRDKSYGPAANERLQELKGERQKIQVAHTVILYSYGASVEEIALSLRKSPSWVRKEILKAGLS